MTEDLRGEEPLPTTLASPAPPSDWSRVAVPGRAPPSSFGAGTLIGGTFRTWGRNALPFAIVGVISSAPMAVVSYRTYSLMGAFDPVRSATDPFGTNPVFVFWKTYLLGWLASIVLYALAAAAVTEGVARTLRGERAGLSAMLAAAFRRGLSVLGATVLMSLAVLATTCTVAVPFILLVGWCAAVPAAVVEDAGPLRALGRSWTLTRGHRWSLFAGFAVVVVVVMVAVGVLQGVWMGVTLASLGPEGLAPGPGMAVPMAVYQVVAGVLNTLTLAGCAVAHHGLRRVKEGGDPALLARVFE